MEVTIKTIKILTDINVGYGEIEKAILNINGVLDAKIKDDNGVTKLNYVMNPLANDYDILVSIMNTLYNEFSLDSEPYIEEDLYDDSDFIIDKNDIENIKNNNNYDYDVNEENQFDEQCHCCCEKSNNNTDSHTHSHTHSHAHSHIGCGCNEGETQSVKGKIVELSISLAILIVGIILSFGAKTKVFSNYVLIVAYAIAGYEVLFEGLINVFKGKVFSENLLMTIASLSAIMLGETIEAVGIMLLFSIGELFEHVAINKSSKIIDDLIKNSPQTATILKDGKEVKVPVNNISVGDIVLLKVGDKLAVDGEIIEGNGSFDTKTITGENGYKDLSVKDNVFGGYIVKDGCLKVKALKLYKDSALSKVVEIVENSSHKKSKKESFIEKFSKWYTPTVVMLALILAFIPPIFSESYKLGLTVWGKRGIMLLCVSCPCALIISVPLAYFCGVGLTAKNGVLVKSTNTLEKLASCDTIVFDKTGTLTKGELKVTKVISTENYKGEVLKYVALLEQFSSHPISNAIISKVQNIDSDVKEYHVHPGKGITGEYKGKKLVVGNYKFIKEFSLNIKEINELGTKIYLLVDGDFAGCVILNDELRGESYGAIRELKDYGITKTIMLTGDNKEYAKHVRKELNMNISISELLPEQKAVEMEKLIKENNNKTIAYVGDGVNDAPVLSISDVGFSMGGLGSDIAIETSDIVITNDDLSKIPFTVRIAKRTNKIAKQNIIVSIGVKALVMLLSVMGITTSLWLAIASDVGVMILAVLNSIRNKFD